MSVTTHVFFDVGGVLGTPGWDRMQRQRAVERFDLDHTDFEHRHQRVVERFEIGRMTLNDYIEAVVFYAPRPFTRNEFRSFMLEQSLPFAETIATARTLSARGRYRMMTINNESAELNSYRLKHFGLVDIFSAFFSSCWLGVAKPAARIYELALSLSQAQPECAVFIDDHEENLQPARALGMRTILFRSADQLVTDLVALGVMDSPQ